MDERLPSFISSDGAYHEPKGTEDDTMDLSTPIDVKALMGFWKFSDPGGSERTVHAMVNGVNALLSKLNHMQEEMDHMQLRQKVQDDLILNSQVSELEMAASAHKRDKELRLRPFKTDQVKRKFGCLIDLEYFNMDINKDWKTMVPNFDEILARCTSVPIDGFWTPSNEGLVNATISSVLEDHMRACCCLDLQIKCLEAGQFRQTKKMVLLK